MRRHLAMLRSKNFCWMDKLHGLDVIAEEPDGEKLRNVDITSELETI
jgi:hypothetical protein